MVDRTFFRDPRFASKTFKTKEEILSGLPKAKFLFFVRFGLGFDLNNPALSKKINSLEEGISFLVQRVDRPRINFETEILSQYNKKRVVQKTHRFDPVTITFYDTYDDRIIAAFLDYYKTYYGEANAINIRPWTADSVEPDFLPIAGPGSIGNNEIDSRFWAGFNPPFTGSNGGAMLAEAISKARHFNYIDIITFGCNVASNYRLVNPIITRFEPGDLEASDTSSLSTTTISVEYEAVIFPEELKLQSTITDDLSKVLKNGEDPNSRNSAWLPEEERGRPIFNLPSKYPGINVNLSSGGGIDGFSRLRPNLDRGFEDTRRRNTTNRILETALNSLGGLNFGRSLSDNRFRVGISSIFNAPSSGLNRLARPITNIASRIGSFRIPGLNPLLNDIDETPDEPIYANEKSMKSNLNSSTFDLCIGLAEEMGIKDMNKKILVAQEIAAIAKRTKLSPIDVVRKYNLSPESTDSPFTGVLAISAKNRADKSYSTQYAFVGDSDDYMWNMAINKGNQTVSYDEKGYPVNEKGRRIDQYGREITREGEVIVNQSSESGRIRKVYPGEGVPEDTSWRGTDNSIDAMNLGSILKNS